MSIRDKNKQVLEKGEADRATFQPAVDSAPLRAYQYWLNSTGREPFRENFCHFWRVVLIWAPLAWLFDHVLFPFFTSRPMRALGRGIAWVFTKPNKAWKSLDYDTRRKVQKVAEIVLISLVAAGVLGILVGVAISVGFLQFLAGIGVAVAFIAVVFGIAYLFERATRKSREKRDAERERLRNLMFTDFDAYLKEVRKPRKPKSAFLLKVEAFFSAVGDYLILIGNVVRVNKWKICPMVEIPVEVDKAQAV